MKQIIQQNQHQRSSLLVDSIPQWLFNEAKRIVPIIFFPYEYGICFPSLVYFFANPKSIKQILRSFFVESRKFYGLMSRCRKPFECTYSILLSIWSASIKEVLSENKPLHLAKRSSSDGPSKSMTKQLNSPSVPLAQTLGTPLSVTESVPWSSMSTLASYSSCWYFELQFSSFTATLCPLLILTAQKISPKAPEPTFLITLYCPPMMTSMLAQHAMQ